MCVADAVAPTARCLMMELTNDDMMMLLLLLFLVLLHAMAVTLVADTTIILIRINLRLHLTIDDKAISSLVVCMMSQTVSFKRS